MLIKFIKPDPRAGGVVRLDSSLAQRFINEGRAERVSDAVAELTVADTTPVQKQAAEPKASRGKK